jgi:hypothetical protein
MYEFQLRPALLVDLECRVGLSFELRDLVCIVSQLQKLHNGLAAAVSKSE